MIPHCRLLSALMIRHGVVDDNSRHVVKPHKSFTLSRLSNNDWHYVKTARYHVLRDIKGREVLRGLRPDAPPLMPGESEEEIDMGLGSGGEDEDENPIESEPDEGPSDSRPRVSRGARGMTGTGGLVFEDDQMEGIVRSRRPVEHQSWPQIAQMNWDRTSQEMELARRRHAELMDRQELYARSQALAFEQEINNRYLYDEEVRHCRDYYEERPYREHPQPVDWRSLPPYSGGDTVYPYPQSHSSQWVPPTPPPGQEASGSGSSDPFNFQTMRDSLYEQWFGPPIPRPPYDPDDYSTH